MKIFVNITVDTNDADYVSRMEEVSKETLQFINKVLKIIGEHNNSWNCSEYARSNERPEVMYEDVLTGQEIENFSYLCPYGEHGFHSVESVEVFYVEKTFKLPIPLVEKFDEVLKD